MDVVLAGSSVNRPMTADQLGRVSIELSADGTEVGVGSLPIDDLAGADEIAGGWRALLSEGVATISDGFIGAQDKGRGGRHARPQREDVYSIEDANRLFYGQRFVARSRPSETDRARVLAWAALDLSGIDTTWVLATNTVTMPAKSYTGTDWLELMTDVREAAGKVIFLHDKANGGGRCLHSHLETEGHSCGLSISDTVTTNGPTVWAPWNPNRNRTTANLANDVYGRDQANRHSTDTDSASITAHDADGLSHQSIVELEARSQADLDAKTSADLAENKDETDSYSCDIGPLDQAALLLIRAGDRITVTSQAMALSSSTIRIAHMNLTPAVGDNGAPVPGFWIAHLELNEAIKLRPRVSSGARHVSVNEMLRTIGPFCIPQPQKETFINDWTGTGPSTFDGVPDWKTDITGTSIIAASGALELISSSAGIGVSSEYIDLPFTLPLEFIVKCKMDSTGTGSLAQIWFGVVFREDGSAFPTARIDLTLDGAGGFDSTWIVMNASGGSTATFTINSAGIGDGTYFWVRMLIEEDGALSGAFSGVSSPTSYTNTASPPAAPPSVPTLIQLTSFETGVGPFFHTIFTIDEITILQGLPYFCDSGTIETPTTGQWVFGEIVGTGDGVTTTFSLDHPPYVPGSLTLRCDIVEEAYVGGNPTTGVVTFSSPPFDTEIIYADYQRA